MCCFPRAILKNCLIRISRLDKESRQHFSVRKITVDFKFSFDERYPEIPVDLRSKVRQFYVQSFVLMGKMHDIVYKEKELSRF
jgi:hypothetical protein